MDDDMKLQRVRFFGLGQKDQVGRDTMAISSQQSTGFRRGPMSNNGEEEYDAAYAATVAAVAYAIAAREKSASPETPAATEKFAPAGRKPGRTATAEKSAGSQTKRPAATFDDERPVLKSPSKRGESPKRPAGAEGSSRISRWLSGKEPVVDDNYDDEQGANVSIKRPLKPAPKKKPESATSGENVLGTSVMTDSAAPSLKKDPSFARKPTERKGSRRFEQDDQPHQMVPKPMSSYYPGRGNGVAASSSRMAPASSEAEAMADAWEKEKMAKIEKQYIETMDTIAEWEAEKKAKARRQKQLKDESESERKRAKALEEYNDEMSRIDRVAAASRLTAEEKRRNAEAKVREKAHKIRLTGKLPSTCACF